MNMKSIIPILIFLLAMPSTFAATSVSLGDITTLDNLVLVEVKVEDVIGLDIASFTVSYLPNSLELAGAVEGSFIPGASIIVNPANGQVVINAPMFDGFTTKTPDVLAKLTFTPKAGSATDIKLKEIKLGNGYGVQLNAPSESNTVTYDPVKTYPVDVSEPGSVIDDSADDSDSGGDGDGGGGGGGGGDGDDNGVLEAESSGDVEEEAEDTSSDTQQLTSDKTTTKPSGNTTATSGSAEASAAGTSKLTTKQIISFFVVLPLILIALGGGGFLTYRHMAKSKKAQADKEQFQKGLSVPGAVPAQPVVFTAQPAATMPVSQPAALQPLPSVQPYQPTVQQRPVQVPVQRPVPAAVSSDPVVAYIMQCKAMGFGDEQIKAELRKQGWGEQDIVFKMNMAS